MRGPPVGKTDPALLGLDSISGERPRIPPLGETVDPISETAEGSPWRVEKRLINAKWALPGEEGPISG